MISYLVISYLVRSQHAWHAVTSCLTSCLTKQTRNFIKLTVMREKHDEDDDDDDDDKAKKTQEEMRRKARSLFRYIIVNTSTSFKDARP